MEAVKNVGAGWKVIDRKGKKYEGFYLIETTAPEDPCAPDAAKPTMWVAWAPGSEVPAIGPVPAAAIAICAGAAGIDVLEVVEPGQKPLAVRFASLEEMMAYQEGYARAQDRALEIGTRFMEAFDEMGKAAERGLVGNRARVTAEMDAIAKKVASRRADWDAALQHVREYRDKLSHKDPIVP